MKFSASALLFALGLSAVLAAPALAADTTLTRDLAAGSTLEIRAIDGSITASPGTTNAVVRATIAARDGRPIDMHVVQAKTAGGWLVCAVPLDQSGCDDNLNVHDPSTRIDFTVSVPAGVKLRARSVSGAIEAKGLKGDVDAGTVSGDVTLASGAASDAQSVSGRLDVRVASVPRPFSLQTVSGDIALALPRTANIDIRSKTLSGGISKPSDFVMTDNGHFVGHDERGTLGRGGPLVKIQTISGAIYLKTY